MENENTSNQGPVIDNNPSAPSGNAKIFAILSYICPLWLLGLLIEPEKNDPFVKHHVNNGIVLSICGAVCALIPVIGWFIGSIAVLVFDIMGIVAAAQDKEFSIPLIGDRFIIVK